MRIYKRVQILFGLIFFYIIIAPAYAQQQRPYKLSELNKNGIPHLLDGIETPEQWAKKKEEIRKVWLEYVGNLPERPKVRFRIVSETQMSDHVRQKVVFNTIHDDEITAFLLIPNEAKNNNKKYPAILALQPTNELGKIPVATRTEAKPNHAYGLDLVSRGYIVLAPDDLTSGNASIQVKSISTLLLFMKNTLTGQLWLRRLLIICKRSTSCLNMSV